MTFEKIVKIPIFLFCPIWDKDKIGMAIVKLFSVGRSWHMVGHFFKNAFLSSLFSEIIFLNVKISSRKRHDFDQKQANFVQNWQKSPHFPQFSLILGIFTQNLLTFPPWVPPYSPHKCPTMSWHEKFWIQTCRHIWAV